MDSFSGTSELTAPVTHDGRTMTRVLPPKEVGRKPRVVTGNLGSLELRDERTQMHEKSLERRGLNGRGKTPIDRRFLGALVTALPLGYDSDRRSEAARTIRRVVHRPRIRSLVKRPERESPMDGLLASGRLVAQIARAIIEREVPQLGHRSGFS